MHNVSRKKLPFSGFMSKTAAQLGDMLMELRKEQMNLRFQKAAGQLANPNRWREVRKTIAMVKTAIGQVAKKESN